MHHVVKSLSFPFPGLDRGLLSSRTHSWRIREKVMFTSHLSGGERLLDNSEKQKRYHICFSDNQYSQRWTMDWTLNVLINTRLYFRKPPGNPKDRVFDQSTNKESVNGWVLGLDRQLDSKHVVPPLVLYPPLWWKRGRLSLNNCLTLEQARNPQHCISLHCEC